MTSDDRVYNPRTRRFVSAHTSTAAQQLMDDGEPLAHFVTFHADCSEQDTQIALFEKTQRDLYAKISELTGKVTGLQLRLVEANTVVRDCSGVKASLETCANNARLLQHQLRGNEVRPRPLPPLPPAGTKEKPPMPVFSAPPPPPFAPQKARCMGAVREVYRTEVEYVKTLNQIENVIVRDLEKMLPRDASAIRSAFAPLAAVTAAADKNLAHMLNRGEPDYHRIIQIFANRVQGTEMVVYMSYKALYPRLSSFISALAGKNHTVKTYIQQTNLLELIKLPMERMKQYVQLLYQLSEYLPEPQDKQRVVAVAQSYTRL